MRLYHIRHIVIFLTKYITGTFYIQTPGATAVFWRPERPPVGTDGRVEGHPPIGTNMRGVFRVFSFSD